MVMSSTLPRSFASAVAIASRSQSKRSPVLALVELDGLSSEAMRKAFAECGVNAIELGSDFASRLMREKFEGCALRLDERAPSILQAIRSSPSNRRMIVYGVASENLDMRPFSKYGINAVLDLPVDRTAALRTARSTCALLLQELRRYVRIPLVIDVSVEGVGIEARGTSREISGGGMSVHFADAFPNSGRVRLAFALRGRALLRISAAICWKQEALVGFQFEDSDGNRESVKSWIDGFLCLK
jgi:hypothetical protein